MLKNIVESVLSEGKTTVESLQMVLDKLDNEISNSGNKSLTRKLKDIYMKLEIIMLDMDNGNYN
jgi:5S rRNA maturation endonuclease (ribonuclease M5)